MKQNSRTRPDEQRAALGNDLRTGFAPVRADATGPAAEITAPEGEVPPVKRSLRQRFGAWLGRQSVAATLFVPAGIWLLANAAFGSYGERAGVWGAALIACGLPRPAGDDDRPRGLTGRLGYRVAWLLGAVAYEVWWARSLTDGLPRWAIAALAAGAVALAVAEHVFPDGVASRPRGRPLLNLPVRVASIVGGFFAAVLGIGLATQPGHLAAGGGVLMGVAGLALVVMGALGIPTVKHDPRPDRRSARRRAFFA